MKHPRPPQLWAVMGVAGAGKTTVGRVLADRLAVPYADADAFHPAENVAKMRAGVPLDDHDRAPWLAAVGAWLAQHEGGAVVSCSALRRSYRDILRRHADPVRFLHLAGPADVVARRISARTDHFMPASLVASQYSTLEPLAADEDGTTVPFDDPVERIVAHVTHDLPFAATVRLGSQGAPA